jgi:hypothetical protein
MTGAAVDDHRDTLSAIHPAIVTLGHHRGADIGQTRTGPLRGTNEQRLAILSMIRGCAAADSDIMLGALTNAGACRTALTDGRRSILPRAR